MRLLITFLAINLLLSNNVFATEQVIVAGSGNTTSSTTEYIEVVGGVIGGTWGSTESLKQQLVPAGGSFSDLRVRLDTVPGASETRTFTIRKNGADTGLTVTLTEGEANKADTVNTATFAAGDSISLINSSTNTPPGSDAEWTVKWTPTTSKETIFLGSSGGSSIASGSDLPIHGSKTDTSAEDVQTVFPTGGTLKGLYVEVATAPGSGNSQIFTVNGTSITCTIANTDTTCNDTSNTVAITAGDLHSLIISQSGTPASTTSKHGLVFETTTDGEFVIAMTSDNGLNATATEYGFIASADHTWGTTESDVKQLGQAMTIKNIYVHKSAAAGAGNDHTFTLRQDTGSGFSSTSLNCAVADTTPTCNASTDISVSDDDLFTVQVVPTSSPTGGDVRISYLGFIDPGGAITGTNIKFFN